MSFISTATNCFGSMDVVTRPKSAHEDQIAKHRESERERHRQMTNALDSLQSLVPRVSGIHESQVQSLQRIARYGYYLKALNGVDNGVTFDDGYVDDIYKAAKTCVETERPRINLATPSRFRRVSSQDFGTPSDDKKRVFLLCHTPVSTHSVTRPPSSSKMLKRQVMAEKKKNTENVDTSNYFHDDSPKRKKKKVVVLNQPVCTITSSMSRR